MSKRNKKQKGFSLIEIVIAIFVLSIGILGLATAFPAGSRIQNGLEFQSIANHLAQEELEELLSATYIDLPVGTIENEAILGSLQESPFYLFKRTTEVSLVDSNMLPSQTDVGLKKITIVVEWDLPAEGAGQSTTLSTIISQR